MQPYELDLSTFEIGLIHIAHKQREPLYHIYMIGDADMLIHGMDVIQLARVESANGQFGSMVTRS